MLFNLLVIIILFNNRTFIPSFNTFTYKWIIFWWALLIIDFLNFSFKRFSSFWCNSKVLLIWIINTRFTTIFIIYITCIHTIFIFYYILKTLLRFLLNHSLCFKFFFTILSIYNNFIIFNLFPYHPWIIPNFLLIFFFYSFLNLHYLELLFA